MQTIRQIFDLLIVLVQAQPAGSDPSPLNDPALQADLRTAVARGLDLGIDFTGGTLIEVNYAEPANLESVREAFGDVLDAAPPEPVSLVVYFEAGSSDTLTAVLFLAWMLVVSVIDNVLKPILLGRGVEVPMLVIFVGAIGGFLAAGIIGLFVGPVLLVLGYRLFLAWLELDAKIPPSASADVGE